MIYVIVIPAFLAVLGYLAAYFYVYKFRNVFKEAGIPYIKDNTWLATWNDYTDADNFFEADQALVRKNGRFFGYFEGRQPFLMVADLDLVRQVLVKDFDSFTDRRMFGSMVKKRPIHFNLIQLRGRRWKHVRQQVTPAFTPNALRRMNPLIWRSVRQLSGNIEKTIFDDFDVKKFTSCFSLDVIASVAFGIEVDSLNNPDSPVVKYANRLAFIALASKMKTGVVRIVVRCLHMFPFLRSFFEIFFSRSKVMQEPYAYFQTVVENEMERRRHLAKTDESFKERSDFLQLVMHLEKDLDDPANKEFLEYEECGSPWLRNGLIRNEIIAQAMTFLIGGFETVSTALSFALYSLAQNSDCQEKLFHEITSAFPEETTETPLSLDTVYEMKYLEMCINESLRLYSPFAKLERKCTRETSLGGCVVPTGIYAAIPIHALHMDPEIWEDPGKFNPERFSAENADSIRPMAFLPFGYGNRNCVGMRLAYLEVKLALIQLVKTFKFEVSPNTILPLKLKTGPLRALENPILLKATRR